MPFYRLIPKFVAGVAFVALSFTPNPAKSGVCEVVAASIARSSTDYFLVRSIINIESGYKKDKVFSGNPWAINHNGKPYHFENRSEAIAFANKLIQNNDFSFDVGCMQLNYKTWHKRFANIELMFSPARNVRFGYALLKTHDRMTGSMTQAIGRYHSRNQEKARQYACRVISEYRELREWPEKGC